MASMFSEVRIGRYRADLVIRYEQVDKKVVLVELERHSDKIFTKSNRIRKKVTHASQQVEDWINEIRLGTNNAPKWLTNQYNPEGFVVIGRSKDLSEDQKQILFSLNVNRKVKIITYDDLLERMKRLMGMIGGLN
ncbi:Shedu anti-phage system protein SduA domain-containing protein [Vibrio alginolyticus]|nr:Shedu anti-phage system protein SduA domain-containing protein [Vibrio alginolyticus]